MEKKEAEEIAGFLGIIIIEKNFVDQVWDAVDDAGFDLVLDNVTGNLVILDQDKQILLEIE